MSISAIGKSTAPATSILNRSIAPDSKDDALTLFLIGGVAYVTAAIAHETIGHGIATYLMGGKVSLFTSVHLLGTVTGRFIDIAGPLNNLIVGCIFYALLRRLRFAATPTRMFLWMAMSCNLLWGSGYMIYSAVLNWGDWMALIRGLNPQWFWRTILAAIGCVGYVSAFFAAAKELNTFVCASFSSLALQRLFRMVAISYLGAGITACAAGCLDPNGAVWAIAENSAPASFLADSGLLLSPLIGFKLQRLASIAADPIQRTRLQLVACTLAISVFIAILGRGIRLE